MSDLQPPPQHPSIRARNVATTARQMPALPARPAIQPEIQPYRVDHGHPAEPTTTPELPKAPIASTDSRYIPTPHPPRHSFGGRMHRSSSEPDNSSITSGLRSSLHATTTLAVPTIVHDASGSSSSNREAHSPSPEPISRTSTSSSYLYTNNSKRPTVNLFQSHRERTDILAALEELRTLELDEFLERASKSMEEVRFEEPLPSGSTHLPSAQKYKDAKSGRTDYLKFTEAWLCAYADLNFPRDLLSSTRPSKFSLSRTRLAMERIYVLVPPSLLEKLLSGDLVRLYRWHDPLKTGKYALTYLACWWYDQIPAAVFVYLAYLVLKPRIWPPTPAEIRRKLAERRSRSKEAKDLHEDFSNQQQVSQMSHSIAASVGIAAVMGGINMATDRKSSSSDEDNEELHISKKEKKKHRGKYGMYKLVMELLERFGPAIEMLMQDQADFAEKAKNLVLWRRPAASKQSLIIIGACALALSIMSGQTQLKLLLLWIWFQFFIIWPLQDRYPRYRRAMNPFWYILWNVPNDAESALEILKQRAAQAHVAQAAPRESLLVETPHHGRRRSIASISQISLASEDAEGNLVEWKHFALYKGVPGHLMLTPTEIYFNSSKGFRTLSSRLFKGTSGSTTPTGEVSKVLTVFREPLSTITLVKKESRFEIGLFDTDGLQVSFADGKTVRLASVSKRDEAFAFILANSTSQRAAAQ